MIEYKNSTWVKFSPLTDYHRLFFAFPFSPISQVIKYKIVFFFFIISERISPYKKQERSNTFIKNLSSTWIKKKPTGGQMSETSN